MRTSLLSFPYLSWALLGFSLGFDLLCRASASEIFIPAAAEQPLRRVPAPEDRYQYRFGPLSVGVLQYPVHVSFSLVWQLVNELTPLRQTL